MTQTSPRLTATAAHETLDRGNWLEGAQGAAVYALELAIPADVRAAWDRAFDVRKDDFVDRLAAADRLVYVGESADAYARIMTHVRGEVRQTAIMRVCPPIGVVGVWPVDGDRHAAEYNRAVELTDDATAVWINGSLR